MEQLQIRQERKKRRWTLEYVSEQVGIAKNTVHDIETGKQNPSYSVLVKLEDLFQKPHRWLFAVADEETKPLN